MRACGFLRRWLTVKNYVVLVMVHGEWREVVRLPSVRRADAEAVRITRLLPLLPATAEIEHVAYTSASSWDGPLEGLQREW